MFDRLAREDPSTQYFAAIPLMWQRKQCPADVRAIVAGWLGRDATPPQRLMAASWLMVQDGKRSTATLKELGRDSSEFVSKLAIAQLWRAELLTLREARLVFWNEQLDSTPMKLRAGSYYLLGESLAKLSRTDEAALAYLRVPTLFPDEAVLGRKCLGQAAALLLRAGQEQEAVNLYQQIVALGAESREGQQAAEQLRELIH